MKQLKAKLYLFGTAAVAVLVLLCTVYFLSHFRGKESIVVGAKNFTESHLLGEILAQLIERETDLQVIRKFNLEGTAICFNALRSGTIDLYVEYTGTAVLGILKESPLSSELFDYVKRRFQDQFGLCWLDPLGFSNHYVLIARKNAGLKRISDLLSSSSFQIAFDPEFAARLESAMLQNSYQGITCGRLMDQVLLYFALESSSLDVISGYSTDGRLFGNEFVVLIDDKKALPSYEAAPLVTEKCLKKHPEIASVLENLKGVISTEKMSYLNHLVEIEGHDVTDVASQFLERLY